MCQPHKLPFRQALGQDKRNADFALPVGTQLRIEESCFGKVLTHLHIPCFFQSTRIHCFRSQHRNYFFLKHHICNRHILDIICHFRSGSTRIHSPCKIDTGRQTLQDIMPYTHGRNQQFTIRVRRSIQTLKREIDIDIFSPCIPAVPFGIWNVTVEVHTE